MGSTMMMMMMKCWSLMDSTVAMKWLPFMDSTMVMKWCSCHEGKKVIRQVIKLLILLIFLGYLMLWIMMPTSLYSTTWLPSMLAKTTSTFFGTQGATLLTYTFPMLFIAALGCVYLHLGKNLEDSCFECESGKNSLLTWKQPVLIKGPLGIVSWIELTIITMFMVLLIWSFNAYVHIGYTKITTFSAEKPANEVWQTNLKRVGLTLGLLGNMCIAFLFFPVTRGSSVLQLVGLTSESSIKYHIWLGHIIMTLFTAHSLCYIVYWAATNQIERLTTWRRTAMSTIAGELSLLFGLVMWATSFPRIRRKMFELFYYAHHLYSLFLLFYVLHVGFSYSCIMLPGLYLFLIDRYIRFLQSRRRVRLLSSRILPCETVELNFSKDPRLNYTTTSIIFINIPWISKLHWHPFTITSNSSMDPDRLSVVIKSEGSWTKKLYEILSSPLSVDHLDVSVEGPYGPTSTHFLRHDTLVMVSGGSGITPFLSIIGEIIFKSTITNTKTQRVLLICAFKNSSELTMLDLLPPISGTPAELQIEAYVTREKQPTMNKKNDIRTIWFKPNISEEPISAILGPNRFLWVGAIICSSFVIFLILLGILMRCYIYPIDHNTDKIYPYPWKSLLNILVMCASIAIVASVVVLRIKKQNPNEAKQIHDISTLTRKALLGSWFCRSDRDLESLLSQCLDQVTNVHFGARPDLKKILMECKGSSIGVLASGPRKMRHEVASICSSGLKDNLHFQSISFTW